MSDLTEVDLLLSVEPLWTMRCSHFAIVAVANAADEELELFFVGCGRHFERRIVLKLLKAEDCCVVDAFQVEDSEVG